MICLRGTRLERWKKSKVLMSMSSCDNHECISSVCESGRKSNRPLGKRSLHRRWRLEPKPMGPDVLAALRPNRHAKNRSTNRLDEIGRSYKQPGIRSFDNRRIPRPSLFYLKVFRMLPSNARSDVIWTQSEQPLAFGIELEWRRKMIVVYSVEQGNLLLAYLLT